MNFVVTDRGRAKLLYKNYLYIFEKKGTKKKLIWKCVQYLKNTCRGRLHSTGNRATVVTPHTHAPDVGKFGCAVAQIILKWYNNE